jgi:hypothetical protein
VAIISLRMIYYNGNLNNFKIYHDVVTAVCHYNKLSSYFFFLTETFNGKFEEQIFSFSDYLLMEFRRWSNVMLKGI